MTTLDYLRSTYGPDIWTTAWVESLPERYFRDFARVLREDYFRGQSFLETDAGRRLIAAQLFVRMAQAQQLFLPWVAGAVDLARSRVLEIGSGTGSCTVSLLMAGAEVHALDIDPAAIAAAEKRREALDAPDRVRFETVSADWLESASGYAWQDVRADVIVCYALLEHLTIRERIVLLNGAMRALPVGGHLVLHETPNRLAPLDWHSSHLPFHDVLPDELAQMNLTRCTRTDRPTHFVKTRLDEDPGHLTALYRQGRGASFHEFDLAIGLDNFEVVKDGRDLPYRRPKAIEGAPFAAFAKFAEATGDVLEAMGIHRGFACASLDLVLRKTAEPIRFDDSAGGG